MKVSERIEELRREMDAEGIDIYIVPTADYHHSEYVGEYFKARQFLTGFTGSAGTAVFTQGKAGLWTDGRYFIQAEKELEGSGVILHRMGERQDHRIQRGEPFRGDRAGKRRKYPVQPGSCRESMAGKAAPAA